MLPIANFPGQPRSWIAARGDARQQVRGRSALARELAEQILAACPTEGDGTKTFAEALAEAAQAVCPRQQSRF